MNYNEFIEYIREHIVYALKRYKLSTEGDDWDEDEEYEVSLQTISKNNGIMLDAITIYKNGQNVCPNLYLNHYYEQYQMGMPVDSIMKNLVVDYEARISEAGNIVMGNILDFHEIKKRIVVRLVNYERNKAELEKCPYILFLDFAITFRYLAGKNEMGVASSLISNYEFEKWEVPVEDLYEIALNNTMIHFPWQMESLAKVVMNCFQEEMKKSLSKAMYEEMVDSLDNHCGGDMYVLTNDVKINGATCILYDHVIENFAKVQERNIIILPSSVHEVILLPEDDEMDKSFLSDMVSEANQSSVGLIDLLSDEVYYYNRETKTISIYS